MFVDTIASGQRKISEFVQTFPQETFSSNTILFSTGSQVPSLYFLEDGCAKLVAESRSGRPITLHIFFAGSLVPLFALFDEVVPYTLSTVTPIVVRVVPRGELERFLASNPDAGIALLQRSFLGMKGLLKRVSQTAQQSAVQQVAGLLIYFAEHFGKAFQGEVHIETKITHEELSRWLGLSRENVSIHMKYLERAGLIRKQRRQVIVPDLVKLREFSRLEQC